MACFPTSSGEPWQHTQSFSGLKRFYNISSLSPLSREINRPTEKNERKYILFDGDVDALWVENMNSVMDDNKLLTLANGERIRLQKHCALLVEVSGSPL